MKLMEHVLTWTLEELKLPSTGDPLLDWGSETVRLAPTLIVAAQMPLEDCPDAKVAPLPPAEFVSHSMIPLNVVAHIDFWGIQAPFLPRIVDNTSASANDHNNVHVRLTLTKDETTRYREVCRANGVTVTDLWLALLALAEIEYTLQSAADAPEEVAQANIAAYERASHFLFGFYFMNHVSSVLHSRPL